MCLRLPCITPCSAEREASASEAGGARLIARVVVVTREELRERGLSWRDCVGKNALPRSSSCAVIKRLQYLLICRSAFSRS